MKIDGTKSSSFTSVNSIPNVNKPSAEDPKYDPDFKPKLKEADAETIEPLKMGEWKDKKGLEELTDLTIGGDIRHALKSKNVDFLKRLKWGCITIGELREITHKIRQLERTKTENPNLLRGNVIDTKA